MENCMENSQNRENILRLKEIGYSYHTLAGEIEALKNVNMDVGRGEFISIVGPSGCGKSTLLSIIAGLLKPEEGVVSFTENSKQMINIGYMLQRDTLFEWRSIFKNIILGLEVTGKCTKDKISEAEKMMEAYGLTGFRNSKPSELSGGMRQRAALIRTLVMEPDILLLDEPFSALDYQTRLSVSDDIYRIIKEEKKTAILVTHDISEAVAMGERVYIMSKRPATIRRVVNTVFEMEDRTPKKVRENERFLKYFNQIWEELEK